MRVLNWASTLYGKGLAVDRALTFSHSLPKPVLSVGNISSGGRGKTPFVIFIAQGLLERGFYPVVLTRGYARKNRMPAWLDRGTSFSVDDSGDEALEIFVKADCPVLVGPGRYRNALRFLEHRANLEKNKGRKIVFILDDGFQHWKIRRNFDLVLTDKKDYLDRLLPAGRLREPVDALNRAHLVLTRGENFEKRSEMKVPPHRDDAFLLLTTRAPDASYVDGFKERYPACRAVELKDHAERSAMLKVISKSSEKILCLGAKEAAKLLSVEDFRNFVFRGHFDFELADRRWDLRFVDCHLAIFNEGLFWSKILEKIK